MPAYGGRRPIGPGRNNFFNRLCLFGLAAFSPLVLKASDWRLVAEEALPSIVRIHSSNPVTGKTANSTGVILDESGRILTTAHGVVGFPSIVVLFGDDVATEQSEATVEKSNEGVDMAVLKLVDPAPGLSFKPIRFNQGPAPKMGMPIAVVGNPLKDFRTMTAGIVSMCGDFRGGQFVLFDAKVDPGNSGGPLLNERGELLGIVLDRVWENGPGLGRALYITDIKRFLDQKKQGFLGLTTERAKTGFNGVVGTEGIKITKISTNGNPFEVGDIIMTFKDYPVYDHDDLVRLVRREEPGTEVEACILRNGDFKVVKVKILEASN